MMALPKRYPKLRRPGHPEVDGLYAHPDDDLVITEKFDGNNFRFSYDAEDGLLQFGSRNVDLGTDPDEIGGMFNDVSNYLSETVSPQAFVDCLDYIGDEILDLDDDECVENAVVFGENAVEHTISDYRWSEVPQFQVFDVFVVSDTDVENLQMVEFLDWDDVVDVAGELGLETVPVYERTTVADFDAENFEVPPSNFRPGDRPAEGAVIRNDTRGVKAKVISEDFAESMREAKSNTADDSDAGKFTGRYATHQRIEKCARKLLADPDLDYEAFQMEMMPDLAPMVWEDIWAEEWHEICYERWTLDIGQARSSVSSKCARVLQSLMRSQTIPVAKVDPGTGEVLNE